MNKRVSGILIHPTSFIGPYGCGDLGDGAKKIIDWLKKAGQTILQTLPLGPTGYGNSPYQAFSAFAGTPYIISFDELIKKGYLKKNDLDDYPKFDPKRVDYYGLYINNFKILNIAYKNLKKNKLPDDFFEFCMENSYWLEDYALFMAIKDSKNGASWDSWEQEIRNRENLHNLSTNINDLIEFYKFIQWEFYNQWQGFRKYAKDNGISIIGDAPIFASYDSADIWANQHLFFLDKAGKPEVVAGVPPDYFSKTGQLWGNPIYRWDVMKKDDYDWWKKRIKYMLKFVDCIRIDHFRGFEAYWEIKYGEKTAINGKWVKVPGHDFFNSLKNEFGEKLSSIIIAEDLGVITDEVRELRDIFNLPGMRLFEFANFPTNKIENKQNDHIDNYTEDAYLPENYIENCVAYPGTHDNDTLKGWFHSLSTSKQKDILNYLGLGNDNNLNYAIIKSIMKSKANRVVFLIQDILELTSEHRMNTPGTCGTHNWSWRILEEMLTDEVAEKIYKLSKKTGRL